MGEDRNFLPPPSKMVASMMRRQKNKRRMKKSRMTGTRQTWRALMSILSISSTLCWQTGQRLVECQEERFSQTGPPPHPPLLSTSQSPTGSAWPPYPGLLLLPWGQRPTPGGQSIFRYFDCTQFFLSYEKPEYAGSNELTPLPSN